MGKAKLCALLHWAPPCLKPLVVTRESVVLFGKVWRGEARRAKGKSRIVISGVKW